MNQDIERLLKKYYEGETTLEEEKQLRDYFQREDLPAHWQQHAAPFRYFVDARQQQPSAQFTQRLARQLSTTQPGRVIRLTSWSLRVAASVGLLLLGFTAGYFYTRWQTDTASVLSSTTDAEPAQAMKKVLTFERLPNTSASERIQAINQSYELGQADREITQLLINTLNFDANVNVRLAACQALTHFENEPGVREALIQSLGIQTDPNIQITLIDALVAIKEKRAVNEIQRLVQRRQVLDAVRQKAEEGIDRLTQAPTTPS